MVNCPELAALLPTHPGLAVNVVAVPDFARTLAAHSHSLARTVAAVPELLAAVSAPGSPTPRHLSASPQLARAVVATPALGSR
jgi:hypothetical protein